MNQEQENPNTPPYWQNIDRVDALIKRLKSKYPSDAEDTEEVCALFEYKKLLKRESGEPDGHALVRVGDYMPNSFSPVTCIRNLGHCLEVRVLNENKLVSCFKIPTVHSQTKNSECPKCKSNTENKGAWGEMCCPKCGWDSAYDTEDEAIHRAHDERLDSIAKELHYPECWDTMAYPTIYDALYETASCSECAPCYRDKP